MRFPAKQNGELDNPGHPEELKVERIMIRSEEELKRKIVMMMTLRMVIIITLLGSALLIQLVSRTILPINPLYFLIFLTSFFTLVYAFGFSQMKNLKLMAYLQLAGDVLVVTLLLYFTGGVNSPFSFLYILVIITSSILLYRRGSLIIASISSIMYGILVDLLYYGILPYYDLNPSEIAEISDRLIYYYIFIHIFAFYSTALLSSYLSERLRHASSELEEKDEDLSDLRILHQKIIDSISAGLMITNLDGEINFINEAGSEILGLPVHNVLGKEIQSFFTEEIRLEEAMEALGKNKLVPYERFFLKDKEHLMIGMNMSFLHSQKGIPSGILVIFQNITESRKMQQQFRIQERMAALGTMAAGIAHEIRNPLAAIRGSVQMLENELETSEDQKKLMEIVLTESLRLDHTIRNFLSYAKPKPLEKQKEDLRVIVRDMLTLIEKSPDFKPEHRIQFSASSEDFIHEFDSNQIKQVIWNLCVNALRAMPESGTLRVTLEHDLQDNFLLTFKDEGKGIEPERLNSIFDPFQESTTGGSGLGMAIVYRIIQDHQGRISIHSKPGSGTTVTVRIPARAGQLVQPLLQ
jgi:two-component system, NtrC family, sensor histidine kinase PilS